LPFGNFEAYPLEIQINPPPRWRMITCGSYHNLAIDERSRLWSWGWSSFVGTEKIKHETHVSSPDSTTFSNTQENDNWNPLLPQVLENSKNLPVKFVAGGRRHTIVITENNEVYSWGIGENFQLGLGNTKDSWLPQKVIGIEGKPIKAACGWGHTLVLTDDGRVYSWGWSEDGQTGHATTQHQPVPELIEHLKGTYIVDIAAGFDHSICIDDKGQVFTFGSGEFGRVGHPPSSASQEATHKQQQTETGIDASIDSQHDEYKPRLVDFLKSVGRAKFASAGFAHTVVCMEDGSLYGFGWNELGQLGLGKGSPKEVFEPQLINIPKQPTSRITSTACGRVHSSFLCDDGEMYLCGSGKNGLIGNGDTKNSFEPILLYDLAPDDDRKITSIAAGLDHNLVLVTTK